MKVIIFYFTGTGNNLFIAKEIARQMPEITVDIKPIKALAENKGIPEKYDWVGFLGPSYYSHTPPFMLKCMEGVKYTKQQKIFIICGCAGNRGMAIQDMRKKINECGKVSSLEYMVVQPGSYILSYGAFPAFYQKLTNRFAMTKIKHIVNDIKNNRKRKNLKSGIIYRDSFEARLQKNIAEYSERGMNFKVKENCIKCGICLKVCPTDNITINDGKVIFGNRCNQCMACIQWCRNKAIYYDEKADTRKRYHNRGVTLIEIINNN